LEEEIQRIREIIELPIRHPELFKHIGINPPKGVLIHGPSGSGKTLLARAISYETEAHFITISGPEIISKFYGQSEEKLRKIFEEAKEMAPSIIYFDRIELIAPKIDLSEKIFDYRIAGQLLTLMDGINDRGEVIIIGETNRIESVDPVFRGIGRFDIEIGPQGQGVRNRH